MAVFLLIHGAWGTPQEWRRVAAMLKVRGHESVSVDLPITDPRHGLEAYSDAALRAVAHVREPVVVVGHSASGVLAALVAARRPTRLLVYLAAMVPTPGVPVALREEGAPPGKSQGDIALFSPAFRAVIVDRGDGTLSLDHARLASLVLGGATTGVVFEAVVAQLRAMVRPNGVRCFGEPWPERALPAVPSVYLVCGADPVLPPDAQRALAARAGAAVVELKGADHGAHQKTPLAVVEALLGALGGVG